MYIFRNSMKNLLRNKGRNILIFLILLVTMTAVTTCAIVRQAAESQIDEYIRSFRPAVSTLVDYNRLATDYPSKEVQNIDGSTHWEAAETPQYFPSIEQLEKWEKSEYVDYTQWWLESEYCSDYNSFENDDLLGGMESAEYYGKDMEYFRQMAVADFEAQKAYYLSKLFQSSLLYDKLYDSGHVVTEDEAIELAARTVFGENHYKEYIEGGISDELAETALDIKIGYSGMLELFISQKEAPTGTVWAYSDFEDEYSYFAQKFISLQEGSYPYKQNECLVSKQFAEMNNLKIGDTIQITSSYNADKAAMLELTISGLFSADIYDVTASEGSASFVNLIFTSPETLEQSDFTWYCPIEPTFYLRSTEDVAAFKQMLIDDGLSEYMLFTDNVNELEEMTETVQKIGNFAVVLMIIILVLGGSIFLLLTFLAICERKYEIGVLRSIGMKKNKVIRGFLYETTILVMLCCIIGMTVGAIVSQPVAELMIMQNENKIEVDNFSDSMNVYVEGQYVGSDFSIEGSDGIEIFPNEIEQIENEKVILQTQLSWSVVLVILGMALILMIAAVVIAGLYITKFEPMNILSDQE